jgi:tetratricopeptide (TPR) repeat protein
MTDAASQELLKKGMAAAKAARQESASPEQVERYRRQARSLLTRVLKMNKNNVQAWLWLSTVVDTPREQQACLKNVLALEPTNKHARAGLARLEQATSLVTPPPANVARDRAGNQNAAEPSPAASPKITRLKKRPIARLQPSPGRTAAKKEPGCPFCEQSISSIDTTCPHCGLRLVMNCPVCGQTVEVEHAACDSCGQKMGNYQTPENYFARLGQGYLKKGRSDDAVTAWQMVEILNPDFPKLYLRLGQAQLGQERPDRAMASLQRALEKTPDNAEVHFTLAEMMRLRAEREKAFDYYRVVIRLDPKHGLAWLRMAGIYQQVGAKKEAVKAYRQAVKLLPPESEESIQARANLEQFEPKMPEAMATGWPELIRQVTGPILICLMAVLFDSGLRPWWIQLTGWLALSLAIFGAFLFVSGSSLPRNPVMQVVVGKQGLSAKEQKLIFTTVGLIFWLIAMGLILWPINQTYPEIPDL